MRRSLNKKDSIVATVKCMLSNKEPLSTYIVDLSYENAPGFNNQLFRWAAVFSWMDYDNTGDYQPYAKIAYQPFNSLMQEYDVDWFMPSVNDTVIDDEINVSGISPEKVADDLIECWNYIHDTLSDYFYNDELMVA